MVSEVLKDALRAVSSGLQIPTIIILIVLIIISVLMLGSVIAAFFSELKALKESMVRFILMVLKFLINFILTGS